MFESVRSKEGATKATTVHELMRLYGSNRHAFHAFKNAAGLREHINSLLAESQYPLIVSVDELQFQQVQPRMRTGHPASIEELARAIVLSFNRHCVIKEAPTATVATAKTEVLLLICWDVQV